eukprot:Platyproteum_vivax@DN6161_c0_g1_i3.p1
MKRLKILFHPEVIPYHNAYQFSSQKKLLRGNFVRRNETLGVKDVYQMGEKIGLGRNGLVRKASHRQTGLLRAIKTIPKSRIRTVECCGPESEIGILATLDHPNVVKLVETFEDAKNFYLVMELCTGNELLTDLESGVGKYSEPRAASIFRQVLEAVSHCHSRQIIHRDIKPENLLFADTTRSVVKVVDFGTATSIDNQMHHNTACGTCGYIAPEVASGKPYNEKCDAWSCGVVLSRLLTSKMPFRGNSTCEVMSNIEIGAIELDNEVSPLARDLILCLLSPAPSDRWSVAEALSHPWVKEAQTAKLYSGAKTAALPVSVSCRNHIFSNTFMQSGQKRHLSTDCSPPPKIYRRSAQEEEVTPTNQHPLQPTESLSSNESSSESSNNEVTPRTVNRFGQWGLDFEMPNVQLADCEDVDKVPRRCSLEKMLAKFKQFHSMTKLKKAAVSAAAYRLCSIPDPEVARIRATFQALDYNCDGTLTPHKIELGLESVGIEVPPDFYHIVNDIDMDGSGKIEYSEFVAATLDRGRYAEESVAKASFDVLDLDNDGIISRIDLQRVLGTEEIVDTNGIQKVYEMIRQADLNEDGQIDFEEYMRMMANT